MNYCVWMYRSSQQRFSIEKGVLGNFIKFTGKHQCQSLFLNKVAGLRQHLFSKNAFFMEHLWWLLLIWRRFQRLWLIFCLKEIAFQLREIINVSDCNLAMFFKKIFSKLYYRVDLNTVKGEKFYFLFYFYFTFLTL